MLAFKNLPQQLILSDTSEGVKKFFLASFAILAVLVLGIDSSYLVNLGFEGRIWSNCVTVLYFCLMLMALSPQRRLMALIFIPFSAIGESIFSLLFEMYHYRLGLIPIYIPYGHAIVFCMGLMLSDLAIMRKYESQLRPILLSLYVFIFSGVILWLQDTLSAVFGLVFLWVLHRKGYQTFYFIMGLLVLYVELLGTFAGCWVWEAHPFNLAWLHSTNPPFGAFSCYILADLGVMKIAQRFNLQPNISS